MISPEPPGALQAVCMFIDLTGSSLVHRCGAGLLGTRGSVPVLMASGLSCWAQWVVLCMVGLNICVSIHLRDAFSEHCMPGPPLVLWAVSKCSIWFQLSFFTRREKTVIFSTCFISWVL